MSPKTESNHKVTTLPVDPVKKRRAALKNTKNKVTPLDSGSSATKQSSIKKPHSNKLKARNNSKSDRHSKLDSKFRHPLNKQLSGFEVGILKLLTLHVSVILFCSLLLITLHLPIWVELGYGVVSSFKWHGTALGVTLITLIVYKGFKDKNHKLTTGQVGLAKVINVDPPKMVVFGQLSKLETKSFPILKVCNLSTLNMGWRTLREGDFLPVISSEDGCSQSSCILYHDIHPEPIEPFVRNDQQRLQVLKLYGRSEFELLNNLIAELPIHLKSASYKVMADSDWEFDQLIHQHLILE